MSILLSEASRQGVHVIYDSEVVDIDFSRPILQMSDESIVKADVVIAAEGMSPFCNTQHDLTIA